MIQNGGKEQQSAFRFLCGDPKIEKGVFAMAARFNLNPEKEDILQESLVIFLHNVIKGKFKLTSQISTYIIGISKNICLDRSRKYKKTVLVADLPEIPEENSIEQAIIQRESTRQDIQIKELVLKKLGDKCAQLLMLKARKFKLRDIAEKMGWSNVQSAKNKMGDCRKKLRNIVENDMQVSQLIHNRL